MPITADSVATTFNSGTEDSSFVIESDSLKRYQGIEMNGYKTIIKNIFSNWMGIAVAAVIGFWMMPFLVHQLGDNLYGMWILIGSLTGYGVLLDLGIRSSIVKYSAQYNATRDELNLNRVFNTSLLIYSCMGTILILLGALFTPYLPDIFHIDPQYCYDVKVSFLLICISLALKFPSGVFEGFLCGIQRYDITNGIEIVAGVMKAIAIISFMAMGYNLIALALITVTVELGTGCLMVLFCLKHLPFLRIARNNLSKGVIKIIYGYGLSSFMITISSRIIYDSDAIIIAVYLPTPAITFFAIANNLIRYMRQVAFGFGNVFNPAASQLEAQKEHTGLGLLVIYGTRYSLVIILPIAAGLICLGKEFISLWMGSKYAELSGTVLVILTISQVTAMGQFASGSVLYGLNKHKALAFILVAESVAKIILSMILIRNYGIIGLALGTGLPELAVYLLFLPWYVCSITGVHIVRYFKDAFLPPLLSSILFACVLYIFKIAFAPLSTAGFIVAILTGVIVYGPTSYIMCFDRKKRNGMNNLLVARLKKASISE